jgi:hypothetical protein
VPRRHPAEIRPPREDSGAESDVPAPGGIRPAGTKAIRATAPDWNEGDP